MKRILCIAVLLYSSIQPSLAAEKESAYDRVLEKGTIRCGYGTSKPWIYQNLETGKLEGLNVEVMEEVARQLGLKLEWPEETGWGQLPEALASGKVDVACSLLWTDPARGKRIAFTRPLFYTPLYAWTREDETRFTGSPDEINNPGVKIVVQDGDMTQSLAKRYFPKAQTIAIPQSASWPEIFMNVTTGKGDIVLVDSVAVTDFNTANEKKLKRIPLAKPVAVYGNSLAVSIEEAAFKEVLDTTVTYLLDNGAIEELTRKYRQQYPGSILLPAQPYEDPK